MTTSGVRSPWTGAWLTGVVLAISVAAFLAGRGFEPATTRYFPLSISAAAVLLALGDLIRRALMSRRLAIQLDSGTLPDEKLVEPAALDLVNEGADAPGSAVLRYTIWFIGYIVGIWVLSMVVASGIFVAFFLRVEAKMSLWASMLSGVLVVALVIYGGNAFNIRWPASLTDPLG
ncbi:MAG: hypothetical protein WD942_06580, partial [Dehalococcoidia bacterium]